MCRLWFIGSVLTKLFFFLNNLISNIIVDHDLLNLCYLCFFFQLLIDLGAMILFQIKYINWCF